MNTNKSKTSKTPSQKQAAEKLAVADSELSAKAERIKLGIDVHLEWYVVVWILDGGTPIFRYFSKAETA